jgi:hypothetical protein
MAELSTGAKVGIGLSLAAALGVGGYLIYKAMNANKQTPPLTAAQIAALSKLNPPAQLASLQKQNPTASPADLAKMLSQLAKGLSGSKGGGGGNSGGGGNTGGGGGGTKSKDQVVNGYGQKINNGYSGNNSYGYGGNNGYGGKSGYAGYGGNSGYGGSNSGYGGNNAGYGGNNFGDYSQNYPSGFVYGQNDYSGGGGYISG